MSGGKRNHEDVSDTMALVQAACKVLAITARPLAHFRHRRQPVRSAIGAAAEPRANGAERHVSREKQVLRGAWSLVAMSAILVAMYLIGRELTECYVNLAGSRPASVASAAKMRVGTFSNSCLLAFSPSVKT